MIGQVRTISSDGQVSEAGGAAAVSGYTILEAGSVDAAVQIANGCPVLPGGASIEVAETFEVM